MTDLNIEELDLYEILEIDISCTQTEIKKAYRKKALQCHPDKNPDNPDAGKEFHRLSKILEILTDEAARKAYDKVLRGRKEAALRHQELDGKRRKLKEDLEARERLAGGWRKAKTADQMLREEIERLRKEGNKQVEEEVELVTKQLHEQLNKAKEENRESDWNAGQYRIKIKWSAAKGDDSNGGYTQELLHRFLSKYGDVTALVMSQKKKGSALVEFKTLSAAKMAVELEQGLSTNPLKLDWLNGPPPSLKGHSKLVKDTDFESVVLMKMRQAEERKRLIEQLKAEDGDD